MVHMSTHHAILYTTPDRNRVLSRIQTETPEAECISYDVEVLSIGEVRRIIDQAYQKPGAHDYRLIVVSARGIAIEAQHALLKIIEEPPLTTRFAFILPSVAGLLPTVLSRLDVIPEHDHESSTQLIEAFIQLSLADRIAHIADIAKKKDDQAYDALYMSLLSYLETNQSLSMNTKAALMPLLPYLRMRGASKKMLWEEIALTVPIAN